MGVWAASCGRLARWAPDVRRACGICVVIRWCCVRLSHALHAAIFPELKGPGWELLIATPADPRIGGSSSPIEWLTGQPTLPPPPSPLRNPKSFGTRLGVEQAPPSAPSTQLWGVWRDGGGGCLDSNRPAPLGWPLLNQ